MNSDGFAGAVFYTLALLLMKFTIFLVIVIVAANGENLQIAQLAGLHRRSPILALGLMVALFSLAGIPPTIGFTGKFLLFVGAIKQGFLILTLIAMVNVVISLYYYLLIIKAAYLLQPVDEQPPIAVSTPLRALTAALIGAMVVAGFFPTYFIRIAEAAARSLL
jgi:NADH-quinone oxidoreductase subunit N